jgi:hypothetical protein
MLTLHSPCASTRTFCPASKRALPMVSVKCCSKGLYPVCSHGGQIAARKHSLVSEGLYFSEETCMKA